MHGFSTETTLVLQSSAKTQYLILLCIVGPSLFLAAGAYEVASISFDEPYGSLEPAAREAVLHLSSVAAISIGGQHPVAGGDGNPACTKSDFRQTLTELGTCSLAVGYGRFVLSGCIRHPDRDQIRRHRCRLEDRAADYLPLITSRTVMSALPNFAAGWPLSPVSTLSRRASARDHPESGGPGTRRR
jgi:hypothetical protein